MGKNIRVDENKEDAKPEADLADVSIDNLSEEELEKLTNPDGAEEAAHAENVEETVEGVKETEAPVEVPVEEPKAVEPEPVIEAPKKEKPKKVVEKAEVVPKAKPAPAPVAEPVQPVADSLVDTTKFSTGLMLLKHRLDGYVDGMMPTLPKSPKECAPYQLSLYRTIRSIIGLKGQDFTLGMEMLVTYFRAHRKGVFYERFVARGFDHVNLPQGDRLTFERLLRLFMVAADLKNRADVSKHVDVALVVKNLPNSEEQQRVMHFFKVD